jgi:bacillithiol system protein YtxJ
MQSFARISRLRQQPLSSLITKLLDEVTILVTFLFIYRRTKLWNMNWIALTTEDQLKQIRTKSAERPQVIFKHSIRCGISALAKSRLERAEASGDIDFYYLDLINNRNLSRKVAEEFNVYHESPQILIIKNGQCVYDESHMGISMDAIEEHAM